MSNDFISDYLAYTAESEPPTICHRWSCLTMLGAMLGRNFFFEHGHFRVFPNLYVMVVGDPGVRKSTAIKMMKKLASAAGYDKWAHTKTSKEKFLLDLEGIVTDEMQNEQLGAKQERIYNNVLSQNLWGTENAIKEPREVFIAADEFNDFIGGLAPMEFYTTLCNLWDWDDENVPFTQRVKNSRSVSIYQPTVSIIGGNTPENFARAFPPEIIGQGLLSRMLLIHGERSGRRYTFPPVPSKEDTDNLVSKLTAAISRAQVGSAERTPEADKLFTSIYTSWTDIADVRFRSYSTRRFTQLLKLCLIVACSRSTTRITYDNVIEANTILSAAEQLMPRALGEFGKSKNSDVSNKIMDMLVNSRKPLKPQDMWKEVSRDLNKITDLGEILNNLSQAGKIQFVKEHGWLPKIEKAKKLEFVDWNYLTAEERKGVA